MWKLAWQINRSDFSSGIFQEPALLSFSFTTAEKILFGRGVARTAIPEIAKFGTSVLLVHGANPARCAWLADALKEHGCRITGFSAAGEPDTAMVEEGVRLARRIGAEFICAIGGGSVIDAGKAIAALVPSSRPMIDHLEVVGSGLPLDRSPLPFIAIATTSGTGAEVTRNAVISVPEHRRKVSLRDQRMLPNIAIVDPELTDGCPRAITLASGLDAITQVIEPYVCTSANSITDALCRDAIPRGLAALRRLMISESQHARDEMAWVSLCGGLALSNSGLGAVHGLAGPLGGLSNAPHGALCGTLLPAVLKINYENLEDAALKSRFEDIAGWISTALEISVGRNLQSAADAMKKWSRDCGLPGLDELGVNAQDRSAAADAAATSSSMKSNPVTLTRGQLKAIMANAA